MILTFSELWSNVYFRGDLAVAAWTRLADIRNERGGEIQALEVGTELADLRKRESQRLLHSSSLMRDRDNEDWITSRPQNTE